MLQWAEHRLTSKRDQRGLLAAVLPLSRGRLSRESTAERSHSLRSMQWCKRFGLRIVCAYGVPRAFGAQGDPNRGRRHSRATSWREQISARNSWRHPTGALVLVGRGCRTDHRSSYGALNCGLQQTCLGLVRCVGLSAWNVEPTFCCAAAPSLLKA